MKTGIPSLAEISRLEGKAFMVGQLFMPAAFVNDSEANIREMEALIRSHHIGGLCFFHSRESAATNFEGPREAPHNPDSLGCLKKLVARYQRAATYPLLIAIDAEWGLAMRLENGAGYPYALTLGALKAGHPLLYETGLRMAADCRDAGIHWNLAPVADVNLNPENPVIGYRAFGSDPEGVAAHALAFCKGLREGGLLSCAKHFPGHGDTAVDSHLALPVVRKSEDALEKGELLPFQKLIDWGVDAVMTGHLSVPSLDPEGLPATLSPKMIKGLLREKMGFGGLVVTDALNMRAVQARYPGKGELAFRAHCAGNDLLCFAEEIPEAIRRICRDAPAARTQEAFSRLWAVKGRVFGHRHGDPEPPAKEAPGLHSAEPGKKPRSRKALDPICEPGLSPPALRMALAAECLTLYTPGSHTALPKPSGLPAPFDLLLAGEGLEPFEACMRTCNPSGILRWDPASKRDLDFIRPNARQVLLALRPPSMKPPGRFGMSTTALRAIESLLDTHQVWICLFGNPYALRLLPLESAQEVLIAYQDMPEFQRQAAEFYAGKAAAPGKLPISLNP